MPETVKTPAAPTTQAPLPATLQMSEKNKKVYAMAGVVSSIGFLGGLYYAFHTKKKFWGYVGFGILGAIAGSVAGSVVGNIVYKEKK